jgi:thiamine phosphate synthase YjbQ (UPF0047 family)
VITIHTKTLTEVTAGCYDTVDITAKLTEPNRAVGMGNGTATLFVNGSAAAPTTIEHEPGADRRRRAQSGELAAGDLNGLRQTARQW